MSVYSTKQTPFLLNMNSLFFKVIQIVCFLTLSNSLIAQPGNYISVRQHTEILENKKKLTTDIDLFFDRNKQVITKKYLSSPNFIMNINSLGEIKTYYPESNEVGYKHVPELSSKRNLIYYFANNLTDHLGLADEGFSLASNNFENEYYVTLWKSPTWINSIESVKMVFEHGLPIYSEYKTKEKKIFKKVYYTNYKDFQHFRLPEKIIEISYLQTGDSIINRTIFSNVKILATADNHYFNFKIPDNAKPIQATNNH